MEDFRMEDFINFNTYPEVTIPNIMELEDDFNTCIFSPNYDTGMINKNVNQSNFELCEREETLTSSKEITTDVYSTFCSLLLENETSFFEDTTKKDSGTNDVRDFSTEYLPTELEIYNSTTPKEIPLCIQCGKFSIDVDYIDCLNLTTNDVCQCSKLDNDVFYEDLLAVVPSPNSVALLSQSQSDVSVISETFQPALISEEICSSLSSVSDIGIQSDREQEQQTRQENIICEYNINGINTSLKVKLHQNVRKGNEEINSTYTSSVPQFCNNKEGTRRRAQIRSITCSKCNKVFRSKSQLDTHSELDCPNLTQISRLVCFICNNICFSYGFLRLHLSKVHNVQISRQEVCNYSKQKLSINELRKSEHFKLKCTFCGLILSSQSYLRKHTKFYCSALKNIELKCKICAEKITGIADFQAHFFKMHKIIYSYEEVIDVFRKCSNGIV